MLCWKKKVGTSKEGFHSWDYKRIINVVRKINGVLYSACCGGSDIKELFKSRCPWWMTNKRAACIIYLNHTQGRPWSLKDQTNYVLFIRHAWLFVANESLGRTLWITREGPDRTCNLLYLRSIHMDFHDECITIKKTMIIFKLFTKILSRFISKFHS